MRKLVISTDADMNGYYWEIVHPELRIIGKAPYSSRKKARAAAAEFLNSCLTDRSTWPEEYR